MISEGYNSVEVIKVYTDTDTLLTKKAWAPQGINDIHVQMAQMSVHILFKLYPNNKNIIVYKPTKCEV